MLVSKGVMLVIGAKLRAVISGFKVRQECIIGNLTLTYRLYRMLTRALFVTPATG